MIARILLSAVLLPGFILLFFLPNPVYYALFAAAVLVLGYLEYAGMMRLRGHRVFPWFGVAWVLVFLLSAFPADRLPAGLERMPAALNSDGMVPLLLVGLGLLHLTRPRGEAELPSLMADFFGPFYLAGLGVFLIKLETLPQGGWWTYLLFYYSWIYDAGAYFVGRTLGRRPLSPFSPNKTLEGVAGGMAASMLLVFVLVKPLLPAGFPLGWKALLALAPLTAVLGQAGDLLESMLKRHAGVKDSGILLSRLGGVLDKTDSPLFIAPLLYFVATHFHA